MKNKHNKMKHMNKFQNKQKIILNNKKNKQEANLKNKQICKNNNWNKNIEIVKQEKKLHLKLKIILKVIYKIKKNLMDKHRRR